MKYATAFLCCIILSVSLFAADGQISKAELQKYKNSVKMPARLVSAYAFGGADQNDQNADVNPGVIPLGVTSSKSIGQIVGYTTYDEQHYHCRE